MAKIAPLSDVNLISTSGPTINSNSDKIETAFDNTLSRDGSSPNMMEANIDLNGNDLLNVGTLDTEEIIVQGQSIAQIIQASADAADSAAAALASEVAAAASAGSASTDAATVASQLANLPEWKGAWLTATAYGLGDLVLESGSTYICIVAHTSGTFATDLTAVKWSIFAQKGSPGAGTGDMLAANNLNDLANKATARSNLGVPSLTGSNNISANWTIVDNPTGSLRFGTDQDIKMWWDDANTIFHIEPLNTPTAVYKMRFPTTEIRDIGGISNISAKFIPATAVELYYNNTKRLETTNTGAKVTGDIVADTASGAFVASTAESIAGTLLTKLMTPDGVRRAVQQTFVGSSLGSNGVLPIKISDTVTFKIQWGTFTTPNTASGTVVVTFPSSFSTAWLGGWVTPYGPSTQMIGVQSANLFNMTIAKGGGDVGVRTGNWLAIGY